MDRDRKIGIHLVADAEQITGLSFDCADDLFHLRPVFPDRNPHILCTKGG